MSTQVVRNMRSSATHFAEVDRTHGAVQFGSTYRMPPTDTRAFCGVHINDGVVMQAGTKVKCDACRYISEHIKDVEDAADPIELREQIVREEIARGASILSDFQQQALADSIMYRLRGLE